MPHRTAFEHFKELDTVSDERQQTRIPQQHQAADPPSKAFIFWDPRYDSSFPFNALTGTELEVCS